MAATLVIGLGGQVGLALQPLLPASLLPVLALSRKSQPELRGVQWRLGTLDGLKELPAGIDTVISLGPLDAIADWLERSRPGLRRFVALGSTSVHHKQDSPDAGERALAERLANAEARLFEFGARTGAAVTVLRPTLLYGNGRNQSLHRLARFSRRWRVLPWPSGASGRRQPVHVDDLARAVLACIPAPASFGRAFDLPGGEVLTLEAMVRRYLAVHAPGARLLNLPVLGAAAIVARRLGKAGSAQAWLQRAGRDQLADAAPAHAAFGFEPRPFEP